MNDVQLLDRLTSAYATLDPPAPTAALAELFESDEHERDAVVVPFVRPRPRTLVRMRHLVAALVATFVLFSGLAVAGALPDPVQRRVASVVGHLGIDLPNPEPGSTGDPSHAPGAPDRPRSPSSPTTGATDSTDAPAGGSTAPGAPSTTVSAGVDLGGVGAVTGDPATPTTLPPIGGSLLPPLTVPQITVPTLPAVTVPQLPIPLPPLSVPLPPLPILGL